jgi:hypothetical protein
MSGGDERQQLEPCAQGLPEGTDLQYQAALADLTVHAALKRSRVIRNPRHILSKDV